MKIAIRGFVFLFLILGLAIPPAADAGRSSHSYTHSHSSARLKRSGYRSHVRYHSMRHATRLSYPYATRDSHGRIKRSEVAKRDFMRRTGYPHGRPGYVVDHIVPLSKGGADDPSNMQWQTKEEAKAKDKWERKR